MFATQRVAVLRAATTGGKSEHRRAVANGSRGSADHKVVMTCPIRAQRLAGGV